MLDGMTVFGIDLILSLQQLGDWLFPVMRFFTFFGHENFYLLVMPVLIWAVDYRLGLRIGVLLLLSGGFNSILKIAFHQPRPFWVSAEVQRLSPPETGFGIPSGHAQLPASVFGLAAATVKRGWLTAAVIVFVLLIGLSRLVLGMHFPQDVLLGWAIGLALLWAFLKWEGQVSAWFGGKGVSQKILFVFALSLAMVLIGGWVSAAVEAPLPEVWIQNTTAAQPEDPVAPYSLDGLITNAAALFGLVCGAVWTGQRGGFEAGGPWGQRALRFLVGLVGVLLFWRGLDMVFHDGQDLTGYALRYLRYSLVGFWISGLGVWVFEKVGLVHPRSPNVAKL